MNKLINCGRCGSDVTVFENALKFI